MKLLKYVWCAAVVQAGGSEVISSLHQRGAAVLRNLSHNSKNHSLLMQAGAVDLMAEIMRLAEVRRIPISFPWC